MGLLKSPGHDIEFVCRAGKGVFMGLGAAPDPVSIAKGEILLNYGIKYITLIKGIKQPKSTKLSIKRNMKTQNTKPKQIKRTEGGNL